MLGYNMHFVQIIVKGAQRPLDEHHENVKARRMRKSFLAHSGAFRGKNEGVSKTLTAR